MFHTITLQVRGPTPDFPGAAVIVVAVRSQAADDICRPMSRYEQVNSEAASNTSQVLLVYTLESLDLWLVNEGTLQV